MLSSASDSFLRLANHAYSQQLTAADLQSAAANNWALMKHLHEVGLHSVGTSYIAHNWQALTNPDPVETTAYYESLQAKTGLQVPASYYLQLLNAPKPKMAQMLQTIKDKTMPVAARNA